MLSRIRPARLLRSPRPPHAFVLTRRRLVYVLRRDDRRGAGPGRLTVFGRALPEGTFREGPAGVPVAGPALADVVRELLAESGSRLAAASLAIPDELVRVLSVELEKSEQDPQEAEEIILWKFSKAFGDPALPLRISWQTVPGPAGRARILAMATTEEAAASIEDAFAQSGVRIGALETASLCVAAVGKRAIGSEGFLVWADGDAATTVFLEGGALRFLRTKATSDPDEALQEIRLAASFVAADRADGGEQPGNLDVDAPCAAGPPGSPIVERFRAFRAEHGGTDPAPVTRAALAPDVIVERSVSREPATIVLPGQPGEDPAVLVALGAMAGD